MRAFGVGEVFGFRLDWELQQLPRGALATTDAFALRTFLATMHMMGRAEWDVLDDARKRCTLSLRTGPTNLLHFSTEAASRYRSSLAHSAYLQVTAAFAQFQPLALG